MSIQQSDLRIIQMLSERLERISADSIWAHRASGVRGALINMLNGIETDNSSKKDTIIRLGFQILEQVAAEYLQKNRFRV